MIDNLLAACSAMFLHSRAHSSSPRENQLFHRRRQSVSSSSLLNLHLNNNPTQRQTAGYLVITSDIDY